ncbi:MAG: hypothetical protein KDC85_10390 [Saprospiraceae bacterium]|nr:hypothetical protein [Saprospiraceae bacterium]MCB9325753.1 hypothetical protein [Lewinellaceae bacterium]
MKSVNTTEDLKQGLNILELEERLEMVNLSAIAAETSWRCDDNGDPAPTEDVIAA